MLADSKLSSSYFLPFALETATVLHNYTPRDGVSPREKRTSTKPDASSGHVFGCKALNHNPPPFLKHKTRPREAVLLSFQDRKKIAFLEQSAAKMYD